jgi:hypothetical protein
MRTTRVCNRSLPPTRARAQLPTHLSPAKAIAQPPTLAFAFFSQAKICVRLGMAGGLGMRSIEDSCEGNLVFCLYFLIF